MTELICEVLGMRPGLAPRKGRHSMTQPIWSASGPIGPRPLSPKALDLLDLAGAIYRAESQVPMRWTDPAVEWRVLAPVRDIGFWKGEGGRRLAAVLSFLNRAKWDFSFVARQKAPDLQAYTPTEKAVQDIMLFSGGVDSLCGAGVHSAPKPEVQLVSFYANQQGLQRELAAELGYAVPTQWRLNGRRGREGMNLIRSFMFLSLAGGVAETFGANRIFQYENGVLGAAIPQAGNYIPTRHAHPQTHRRMMQLFESVFERSIAVTNPFIELTKRETVHRFCAAVGKEKAEALLRRTETCWYLAQPKVAGEAKLAHTPCGVCTPCIVRRTARPDEVAAGAWEGWKGYAYDLRNEITRHHPKLGMSFRAYLELVDIALSNPDDARLIDELAPEARALTGSEGLTEAVTAGLLRRFAAEFCDTFEIEWRPAA